MSSVLELQSGGMTSSSSAMGIFPVNYGPSFGTASDGEKDQKPVMRLREPRDLYSTTSLQHPPKYPIECQVIPETIRHIETVPAKLEPFYAPTYSEPQPMPVGESMGTIVYDYQPKLSVDYFCRSCVGGSDMLQNFDVESEPNALKFESRFESGNLARAIKITANYYELHLRQDLYTDRHSQWFYFRIQNVKENVQYRFSIVNFNKPDSLYKYGLKILMYSEMEAQLNKIGWTRCGQNISYFKNGVPTEDDETLYTLTFNLKFKHNNDTVYLAHCYPYTYTQLQNYLRTLEDDPFKSELLTVRLLCRSLAGNNVYVVTIQEDNYNDENIKKPAVVISARVHPGETQSSFMMKGIIDFLTSDCPQAKELRERFIFKLIPMLNPDGVIVGNSRCCLLGQDLNRQYRTVLREAFPQIYQTKVLLRRLVETNKNGVFMYCDIHGHSRRNNVFIYGCENRKQDSRKLIEQIFPLMMHKNSADKFSFQNCKFRVQKTKEGTGRVFAWTLGIVNSFTLEISLGGSTMPSRPGTHFNTGDYEAVGRHFCETLLDFSDPSLEKELLREKILQKLTDSGSNADEPVNVTVTDYSSLSHSDSEESIDGSNNKKSSDIPAINPLKRQASLRISKKRPKPTIVVTASSASSTTIKLENQNQRTVFSLNKASVSTIKLGQRKASFVGLDDEISEDVEATQKELAVFRRLTKFRRKAKVRDDSTQNVTYLEKKETSFAYTSGPKCTSILFDDPFNPPGGMSHRKKANTAEYMEDDFDNDSGSGTEDECNEKDGAIKNMPNFTQTLNSQDTLMNDCIDSFGRMRICGFPDRSSALMAPFIPRLPQGKPLQQMKSLYSSGISETKLNSQKNVQLPKKKSFDDEPPKKSQTVIQRRRASLATTTAVSTSSPSKHYNIIKPQRSMSGSLVAQTIGSRIINRKEKDEKSGNTGNSNSQQQSSSNVTQKRSRFKHSKHSKKSS